ncbi:putative defense protein Hdd11-like [Centruroides sculpturatus]|uniref:putative defense protein Hdd11-like n=1 Tax=Centruroides sculpturatus TaxID=218467 RepID=UPI000C6ECE0D|nr:putative defense protein Hdd11-like [Centruroides sculpturatus]
MKPCLAVLLLATACYAFPNGAPPDSCEDLLPKHAKKGADGKPTKEFFQVQTSVSPYKLEVKALKCDLVELTIIGANFKGFMIRAYDKEGKPIEGHFVEEDGLKTIKCDEDEDTATHTNSKEKDNFTFQWKYPEGCDKEEDTEVIFKGSIMKSYSRFWMVESEPAILKNSD